MKKVGIVGTRGVISDSSFMDTDYLLNKVGANTGNLLFQYAVYKTIDEPSCIIGVDIPWDIKRVKEECRVIVIPSANFIRENFDFTMFVEFLEKTELPLVFVGLGAQATDFDQTEFDFHPSIFKLIELVKERCKTAGVRGGFTKSLLEKLDVSNSVITGCPSNFINPDPDLPEKLNEKWDKDINSFIATGDEPWPKDLSKRDVERKLITWVVEGSGIFVQQSVAPFMKYVRQSNLYQTTEVPSHHEESLRSSIAPELSTEEFKRFIATKLRVYYSVHQWFEDSARFDFSIGLRLHGNMAAWQSGTPAVWICHDSRTRELAETMCLPHISHKKFMEADRISDIKKMTSFDFSLYKKTREELQRKYCEIFAENEIKSTLG